MTTARQFSLGVFALSLASGVAVPAHAETLRTKLARVLQDHSLMLVVNAEAEALEHQSGVERSRWFPTLTADMSKGRERYASENSGRDWKGTDNVSVGVQQTVWDFGVTSNAVRKADATVKKKSVERSLQEQNLLMAGIEAHLRLRKAWELVRYARDSEGNVKRQTLLESARVEAGKGYNTDVLQAKVTYAQVEARRIAAEGEMEKAQHRYVAVFDDPSVDPSTLEPLSVANTTLPRSLEDLLAMVESRNPDLMRAREMITVADADRDLTESKEWAPSLKLVGAHSVSHNESGVAGALTDSTVKLKLSWQLDVGGRAIEAVRAADANASAERARARYAVTQALEEARNAWNSIKVAKERMRTLKEQMDLQVQFLQLARKEREIGRRSLLDVLNGETQLLNAQADYQAAQIDYVLSAERVIRSYGGLSLDTI